MNAMLGLLEWLEQTELNAEQASVLAHVRQAGNELLGLLNDVLDFSRNETRQLRLSAAHGSGGAVRACGGGCTGPRRDPAICSCAWRSTRRCPP